LSPDIYSENIHESEYKDNSKKSDLFSKIRKLQNLSQLKSDDGNDYDDTIHSHNVSNIEKFINDNEKKNLRFQ
jgi:hypothetical protein